MGAQICGVWPGFDFIGKRSYCRYDSLFRAVGIWFDMVGPRRKSWVMRTSSKNSTFETLEGRNTSFSMSRRSIAGASGGLNAPQVVVAVTEELSKPAESSTEKER